MIVAQRFTVSCSVASAIATARYNIAMISNISFIGYLFANVYRNGCLPTQSDMRRIAAAHVTTSQYLVWLRPGHLMTLHGNPEQRPLFGSKCRHRIHASGAVGREETGKERGNG